LTFEFDDSLFGYNLQLAS